MNEKIELFNSNLLSNNKDIHRSYKTLTSFCEAAPRIFF